MPWRDRAMAWTGTPCSPRSRMIVRPIGVSAPSRIAGGYVVLSLIRRARTRPLSDCPHSGIDDVEALLPIGFAQTVRVMNVRPTGPAPQAKQSYLAGHHRQTSQQRACLPWLHDYQQVPAKKFEILGGAGAMLREFDRSAGSSTERAWVGRRACLRRKTKGCRGQTVGRGAPLCIGTAADVAMAYENNALHPVPADFLEVTVTADGVFDVGEQEPDKSPVAAEAGAYPGRIPSPKRHRQLRRFRLGGEITVWTRSFLTADRRARKAADRCDLPPMGRRARIRQRR